MAKKILLLLLFLFGLGLGKFALAGFGISPPYIKNDHIIPGSTFEQTITLLRSSAEEDLQAEVLIDAPEVEPWIKVDKGLKFIMPKGELRVPMKVKVSVPKGADVGRYQGHMNVKVSPVTENNQPGVSVALGARIEIDLTLTNESLSDFIMRLVTIPDLEELTPPWNWKYIKWFFYRIKVAMNVENTGNTKVAPTKVLLDIYDLTERNLLESTYDKSLSKVDPFSMKEITASFPTNLKAGQYWGKVKVYKGDQVINTYKLAFTIHPAGALGGKTLGNWPKIIFTALAVLALIFIFLFFRYRWWIIFVILASLIWKLLVLISGPLLRFIIKQARSARDKIFEWILKKAKENDRKN